MIALIHGTTNNNKRADRIAGAVACMASLRFGKKVLVLPMSNKFDVAQILTGAKTADNAVTRRGYTFTDKGFDSLIRRQEQGSLNAEAYSDCCENIARQDNAFDVAAPTKRPDLAEYIEKHETFLQKMFSQASPSIYDLIILVADSSEVKALEVLQRISDTEVTIISQGEKEPIHATKESLYCVSNYDQSSIYNHKKMKEVYGIQADNKLYPVPYNILFKDNCRGFRLAEFMTKNVRPDQTDDNFVFIDCVAKLASAILGQDEPRIQERKFFDKDRPTRR